jgi:hypothetical protein
MDLYNHQSELEGMLVNYVHDFDHEQKFDG